MDVETVEVNCPSCKRVVTCKFIGSVDERGLYFYYGKCFNHTCGTILVVFHDEFGEKQSLAIMSGGGAVKELINWLEEEVLNPTPKL